MDILSFILGMKQGARSLPEIETLVDEINGLSVQTFTVTFIGLDGSVIYEKSVLSEGNCKDPTTTGEINTPTKEMTASEVYTFSGWSLTSGGAADPNALNNILEDRTVYAAFTASARKYTIKFYSGNSLLYNVSAAYGTIPSVKAPTKEGYDFIRWNPELVAVTGDATYYAQWQERTVFSTLSWSEIETMVANGAVSDTLALGDLRTETLTYSDGTTENVQFEIVDMDLSSNPHFDDEGVTLAIMSSHVLATPRIYEGLTSYVNDELFLCLSEELRAVIKPLSNMNNRKLLVPDLLYVWGDNRADSDVHIKDFMYESFANGKSLVCRSADGAVQDWWTDIGRVTYSGVPTDDTTGQCYIRLVFHI